MAFVRIKTLKGNPYGYLVKNEWTPWGSRQRVAKYLGRVHQPERVLEDKSALPETFRAAVLAATRQELLNHAFRIEGTCLTKGAIIVNLENGTVRHYKKSCVIGMNEGFLCDHTLQQLLGFTPLERDDKTAARLANHVLEAGLHLSEEQFVHLFGTLKATSFKKDKAEEDTR